MALDSFSKAKASLIFLAAVILGLSLAMLGLAAHNIGYYSSNNAVDMYVSIPTPPSRPVPLALHCVFAGGLGPCHAYRSLTQPFIYSIKVHVFTYNDTSTNQTFHTANLGYGPSPPLDMGDQYSLLTAGILGAILGLMVLFGSIWKGTRTVNISLSGRTVSTRKPPTWRRKATTRSNA